MSPWQMVAALGIYTDEQIEDMTWAECVEILTIYKSKVNG